MLRPLSNNLLVRRAKAEEVSAGGLYIPETAKKKPHRGTVAAAGPGYHTERGVLVPTSCGEGDIVIFPDGVGHEVTIDGETFVVVSEDAVIAVVEVDA